MTFRMGTDRGYPRDGYNDWVAEFCSYAPDRLFAYGIANRHRVGVDTIMWTSDYPHAGSDWPFARERIHQHLHDVAEEERQKILSSNAMRFYGIDAAVPTA